MLSSPELRCTSPQVTALAVHIPPAPRPTLIAGGTHDGTIRLWEVTGEELVTFRGHRAEISALCFLGDGLQLASGSNDTDFIVWDVRFQSVLSPM